MGTTPTGSQDQRKPPTDAPPERERPVLPDRATDDLDIGWGDDDVGGGRDDEWYRRERPPHHE